MNRLQSEVHRLYAPPAPGGAGVDAGPSGLVDASGRVRAMVLALARPADWAVLSRVWNGVQGDLALPAPAIAVSGRDACQLWFSLLEPVAAPQARAFLEALRRRYLGDVDADRVALWPAAGAATAPHGLHADPVPALQADTGHWSAFVAPDLAALFEEEPWLDLPPNLDGQAGLLARLRSLQPADFQRALALLDPAPLPPPDLPTPPAETTTGAHPSHDRWARGGTWQDPSRFLLEVMNDGTVALALRIEAAKALLHHAGTR